MIQQSKNLNTAADQITMIDETIKAIAELPDGELSYYEAGDGMAYQYGGCEHYESGVTGVDLKALAAELKELREFVGAIKYVGIDGHSGAWDGKFFEMYHDGLLMASGTDPFDAWRKVNAGEGE